MRAHLIANSGEALPVLDLTHVPKVGDTLALDDAPTVWRVLRVHWPIIGSSAEAVELHICPAGF